MSGTRCGRVESMGRFVKILPKCESQQRTEAEGLTELTSYYGDSIRVSDAFCTERIACADEEHYSLNQLSLNPVHLNGQKHTRLESSKVCRVKSEPRDRPTVKQASTAGFIRESYDHNFQLELFPSVNLQLDAASAANPGGENTVGRKEKERSKSDHAYNCTSDRKNCKSSAAKRTKLSSGVDSVRHLLHEKRLKHCAGGTVYSSVDVTRTSAPTENALAASTNLQQSDDQDPNVDLKCSFTRDSSEDVSKQCPYCQKHFSLKQGRDRHIRDVHKVNSVHVRNAPPVRCPLCRDVSQTPHGLRVHLADVHEVNLDSETLCFDDMQAFQNWKGQTETETVSYFVLRTAVQRGTKRYMTFVCNRNGSYVSRRKGPKVREMRAKGSRKTGSACPARMQVTKNSDGKMTVLFCSTHVGHDMDVEHLNLNVTQRQVLATELLQGTSKRKVLENIGELLSPGKRLCKRLTCKDLNNIKASFNMNRESKRLPEKGPTSTAAELLTEYQTVQCEVLQREALPCEVQQCEALQCEASQCEALQCEVIQYEAVSDNSLLCGKLAVLDKMNEIVNCCQNGEELEVISGYVDAMVSALESVRCSSALPSGHGLRVIDANSQTVFLSGVR